MRTSGRQCEVQTDESGCQNSREPFDKRAEEAVEAEKSGHSSWQAFLLRTFDKSKSTI